MFYDTLARFFALVFIPSNTQKLKKNIHPKRTPFYIEKKQPGNRIKRGGHVRARERVKTHHKIHHTLCVIECLILAK